MVMVPVTLRGSRAALTLAAIFALASLVVTGGAAAQQGTTWSFDDQPAGKPPPAFVFAGSPRDQVGQWVIVREGSNGVLAQVQQGRPGARLAVVEGTSFADLILSTRIRFAEGAGSAGLVWRYRDAENYYLAALDLRRQAIRIYRVVRGNRTRLEDEDDLELDATIWHALKVEHQGMRTRVWINGVPIANARDRTLQEAGAIGLWTAGDAVAWFDDLHVEEDLRVEPARTPERNRRRR